jgi:effector-binding domain-containing protein
MNIVKKVLIGLVAAVGLLIVVGLLLPKTAHVERNLVINAAPATVFTVLNGFGQFDRWSPWAGIDPNAKTTYEGPAVGVGAKMSWSGNAEVGTGSQEIVESTPYSHIKVRLGFGDFPGSFLATYALREEGGGTKVIWSFDADYGSSLMGRYFGLLSDRMLGPDYEKGLAQLKAFVEKLPPGDFSALKFEPVETDADPLVLMSVHSADNPSAIGVALGVAYGRLSGYINAEGLKQVAPPIAIHRGIDNGTLAIDAAIPVNRADGAPAGTVRTAHLPGGHAMRAEYRGPYTGLAAARASMLAYLAAAGLEVAGPLWEQYVSDPAQTPDAQLITHIYAPIK